MPTVQRDFDPATVQRDIEPCDPHRWGQRVANAERSFRSSTVPKHSPLDTHTQRRAAARQRDIGTVTCNGAWRERTPERPNPGHTRASIARRRPPTERQGRGAAERHAAPKNRGHAHGQLRRAVCREKGPESRCASEKPSKRAQASTHPRRTKGPSMYLESGAHQSMLISATPCQ